MKNYFKKIKKKTWYLLAFCFISAAIVSVIVINKNIIQADSNIWLQTTWTGGADTVNFPDHTNNKTGWTKYYSKNSVDTTADELKLDRYAN